MWVFAGLKEKSPNYKLAFRLWVLCSSPQKFCLVLSLQQNSLFSWILREQLGKIWIPEPLCLPLLALDLQFSSPVYSFLFSLYLLSIFLSTPSLFWECNYSFPNSLKEHTRLRLCWFAPCFCCLSPGPFSLFLHLLPPSKHNFMPFTKHIFFWLYSFLNFNSPFLSHYLQRRHLG